MSLKSEIESISGCIYEEDKDLTSYTTMRLASRGDVVEVKSIEALQKLLPLLNSKNRKYLLVGWGANQILPAICSDLIVHLDFVFDQSYFNTQKDEYHLPASVGLNYLSLPML